MDLSDPAEMEPKLGLATYKQRTGRNDDEHLMKNLQISRPLTVFSYRHHVLARIYQHGKS